MYAGRSRPRPYVYHRRLRKTARVSIRVFTNYSRARTNLSALKAVALRSFAKSAAYNAEGRQNSARNGMLRFRNRVLPNARYKGGGTRRC